MLLSGNNSNNYTGLTTVSLGTLRISDASALGGASGAAQGTSVGIGGALDLVDSLLFTAPLLFFYLRLVVRVP